MDLLFLFPFFRRLGGKDLRWQYLSTKLLSIETIGGPYGIRKRAQCG